MAAAIPTRLPRTVFNRTLYNQVQSLWFANCESTPDFGTMSRWFGLGSADDRASFDSECSKVGQSALQELSPKKYPLPTFTNYQADRLQAAKLSAPLRELIVKAPEEEKEESYVVGLSLILLLDQLTRNTFREVNEQGIIYSHYDRLARLIAYSIVAPTDPESENSIANLDLTPKWYLNVSRMPWFYLPLMHSESLDDHALWDQRMDTIINDLKKKGDEAEIKFITDTLPYKATHTDLIRKYGRYPHRNAALGRESTAEEKKYIEEGGDTFGTKTN